MKVLKSILFILSFAITANLSAQWSKITLPNGAYPNSLTISGNIIFLGTLTTGVFRSDNDGQSWTEINTNIVNKQIWSLSVIDNTIFVGTASGGLYRTTDNGSNWTVSNSGISSTTIIRSVAKFNNKLFAASSNKGIYISEDNGSTWNQHNTGISGLVATTFLTTDTDLFTSVLQAVYKYDSTNQSWTKTNTGMPNASATSLAYYNNAGNKKLFAGLSSSVDIFCKSEDNASSWTIKQNGLAKVPIASMAIVGSTILVANDYGVYSSDDFGENWVNASTGFTLTSYASCLTKGSSAVYTIQGASLWKRSYTDFGVTGLKDQTYNTENLVYPNPVKNIIQIKNELPLEKVEIFTINGELIYQANYPDNKIDISNLNNGLYIIKLYQQNNTNISRFIKI